MGHRGKKTLGFFQTGPPSHSDVAPLLPHGTARPGAQLVRQLVLSGSAINQFDSKKNRSKTTQNGESCGIGVKCGKNFLKNG